MLLAGGTDLLPNMKRRQQTPKTVIGLRGVRELSAIVSTRRSRAAGSARRRLAVTSTVRDERIVHAIPGPVAGRVQVATPHLRNMGTIGGNLCLDTRCTYYDQNYEWRKAIDFCMKKDGQICWVATSSPRCLAVSSTDTAPMLQALDAWVAWCRPPASASSPVADLYENDGMHYLTRRRTRSSPPCPSRQTAGAAPTGSCAAAARSTFPVAAVGGRGPARWRRARRGRRGSCSAPSRRGRWRRRGRRPARRRDAHR